MKTIDLIPLKKAWTVLDCGAYVGHFTKEIRQRYPESAIYAIEPCTESYNALCKNVIGMDYVHCFQFALTEFEFPTTYYFKGEKIVGVNTEAAWMNLNGAGYTNSLLDTQPGAERYVDISLIQRKGTEEVPSISIDRFCEESDLDHLDILKLDLQGYDYRALQGAKEMLSSTKCVVAEMIYVPIYIGQGKPQEIQSYLEQYHFRLVGYGEGENDQDGNPKWQDAVFVR